MLSPYITQIFAEPLETLGNQFSQFYSICNALICIPKYFYCIRTRIQPFSGLHSFPSNWYQSTAIPHLHSPKSIGALFSFNHSFLIYNLFLSPFAFLPFSSYFFCVLCFKSLYLCSCLSHYLFPNIFEYLYTHVFVVSQYFELTSSTSPLRFAFCLQLIIVSALVITFAIVLHTVCTCIIHIHNNPKHCIICIVP